MKLRIKYLSIVFCLVLVFATGTVLAGNIDPDNDGSQYCWGENA